MRWMVQRFAEQALGRRRIAQRRQQEVDSGAYGIDSPVKVTPTALHANIGLIDPPGFVGWLEMRAQPLFQCGTVCRPRSASNSSTSRSESEYRRYQRTAQRISSGAVCRHLKIAGRVAYFTVIQATNHSHQSCNTYPGTINCKARESRLAELGASAIRVQRPEP